MQIILQSKSTLKDSGPPLIGSTEKVTIVINNQSIKSQYIYYIQCYSVDRCNEKHGYKSPMVISLFSSNESESYQYFCFLKPWMALTEMYKGGRLYQRTGAWREGKKMGYHVSDTFRPLYEKEFFLFFKGIDVLYSFITHQSLKTLNRYSVYINLIHELFSSQIYLLSEGMFQFRSQLPLHHLDCQLPLHPLTCEMLLSTEKGSQLKVERWQ